MQTESRTAGAATCPHMMQIEAVVPGCATRRARRGVARQRQRSRSWLSSRNADDFPYDAVVAEFHRVGKHFVATELLEALAGVRAALPEVRGSVTSVRLLDRFLDAALDKWDGRYANPTYLGLESAAPARGGRPQPRRHRRRAAV